ncbi:MAG: type IV toxin-antitoxin system AbiEi family antitoxin domain-containing protein [Actinobacteria bacterium]|nr:type IV toxin-antitoxin system AbiEi family antitoxin domain-containing protein [Actinomycetota bacterium]
MEDKRRRVRAHDRLAALATRQHGVISARQLASLDYARMWISDSERSGRLLRVYRGVYAVGHEDLTWEGWCMAAVLAAAPARVVKGAPADRRQPSSGGLGLGPAPVSAAADRGDDAQAAPLTATLRRPLLGAAGRRTGGPGRDPGHLPGPDLPRSGGDGGAPHGAAGARAGVGPAGIRPWADPPGPRPVPGPPGRAEAPRRARPLPGDAGLHPLGPRASLPAGRARGRAPSAVDEPLRRRP